MDAAENWGCTALMLTAQNGRLKMAKVRCLLQIGFRMNEGKTFSIFLIL